MSKTQTIITRFDSSGIFAGLILPSRFRKRQSETRFKQCWNITYAEYFLLMRKRYSLTLKRWVSTPRYQRGSIQIGASGAMAAAGVVASGNVVLTAHNFLAITNGPCTSGVRFETDGQLFEINSVTGEVEQDGEWWSDEPAVSIGSSYAVRYLTAGRVGTWTFEAASADNWVTMTPNRIWSVDSPLDTSKTASATFEVGPQPSGPADDSAVIECIADDIGL